MADKPKQMHRKKILLMGGILMVALVAGLCVQKPEGIEPTPLQPAEELKLSDFPEAFKDSTLIIVGDNTSDIEMQAVNEIAEYLENETGNKPLIKKHSEITEEDKRNYNLIVVGTPKTNPFLEEVYAMTNVTRVTEEFPGEGKGVLEILPNPWDESKAMLLVEGWDERGLFSIMLFPTKEIHIGSPTYIYPPTSRPITGWGIEMIPFSIGLFLIGLSVGVGTRVKRRILWIPILIMFSTGVFLVLASFVGYS